MTTPPDWIKAAAEEIGERDAFVEWFEQINLPNRGAEIAEKIIRKHCPMEPDVAYMPVPRCETCRWWGHHSGVTGSCSRLGRRIEDDEDDGEYEAAGTDGNCEEFYCRADFGCVGHEPREKPEP